MKTIIDSPFGSDKLLLRSMVVTESLGGLFDIGLEVLCADDALDLESALGKEFSINVPGSAGKSRSFSGYLAEIALTGDEQRYASYRLKLVPWTWFLSKTTDCRIYQQKKVPDIIKEVFRDNGFADFKDRLSASYRVWDYCVQYREDDFNFICRLMEQEGIYFYFTQEDGKHTLILADGIGSHDPLKGLETIPFYPPGSSTYADEHVYEWAAKRSLQPGKYAVKDYDPLKPKSALLSNSSQSRNHAQNTLEVFDYPGEFEKPADGDAQAKIRLEARQSQHERLSGAATALSVFSGATFTLAEHPQDGFNREYLITAVTHRLSVGSHRSGSNEETHYRCMIEAIDRRTPFRTSPISPKPTIAGLHTATVVGKAGDEICTDEHGRIKVQFHWDRYGKRDEKSTCWIRVAQQWAGSAWGAQFIPRVGHEVVVSFLEGDPDRPLVIGSVYNGDNKPPYAAKPTQSGWKTKSTKSGGEANYNELRFDDEKGKEEVFIHAERDMREEVENDHFNLVGNDENTNIKRDRKELVERDEMQEVKNDRLVKIGHRYQLEAGDEIHLKTGQSSLVMKSNGDIQIKGVNISIQGSQSVKVEGSQVVEVKGLSVKVDGGTLTQVSSGATLKLTGVNTSVKGAMLALNGDAMATLKGGITMIN